MSAYVDLDAFGYTSRSGKGRSHGNSTFSLLWKAIVILIVVTSV